MGMNGRQMIWRGRAPDRDAARSWPAIRTATVAVVATATLAAYVDSGGFGRYIVDGFAVKDNVKVFAGGLLVALLAIGLELVLALVQRASRRPGSAPRAGSRSRARRRPLVPARTRALTRPRPTGQILTDSLTFRRHAPG